MSTFDPAEFADRVARVLLGTEGVWRTVGRGLDRHEEFVRHWTGNDAAMTTYKDTDGYNSIRGLSIREVTDAALGVLNADNCPTCTGPSRETVGMICQTCGTDYAGIEATP